jgi:hypothetical protein
MGKRTKLREAQRLAVVRALSAQLRARAEANARRGPPFITRFCDFATVERAKIDAYRAHALRAPEQWRCRLRPRAPELRFRDLVRFTFARYPVAAHLENCWTQAAEAATDGAERPDFRYWYIIAVQGGSLYERVARYYLSRRETHHFLNAPPVIAGPQQAFWYAFARASTRDTLAAIRVARSRIATLPVGSEFWQDVARYAARNRLTILEVNELIDFLEDAVAEDARFSLKGVGLPALRRQIARWRQRLGSGACRGSWPGLALHDVDYPAAACALGATDASIWRLRQLRSSRELFREGERMQHCVATYKGLCMGGHCSIWSLSCEHPCGRIQPRLTIEVTTAGTIVQCRGYANRLPLAAERAVLQRWAADHRLTYGGEG